MNNHVTIVMPCYNSREFIDKTLESIINQTHTDWDLVIVDDCSTDGTYGYLKEWFGNDDRITILQTELNSGGPSIPRNQAISHSRFSSKWQTRYIAYCDSDDIWKPEHLESGLYMIEQHDFDLVYSKPEYRFESGEIAVPFGIAECGEFNREKLFESNYIWISSVIHKTECNEVGDFDDSLNGIEDWDYWCRIANRYRLGFSPITSVEYIVRGELTNASSLSPEKLARFREKRNIDNMVFNNVNDVPVTNEGQIKLHLGCGDIILPGWTNCDLHNPKADVQMDCADLSRYGDNSVDEIYASHLIEHFDFFQGQDVLKEWYRVLKPGGRLSLETPDLLWTCKYFVEGDEDLRVLLYGHFFAWPWLPGQTHKFLYTEKQLVFTLEGIGFKGCNRIEPDSIYVQQNMKELYLKMEAFKDVAPSMKEPTFVPKSVQMEGAEHVYKMVMTTTKEQMRTANHYLLETNEDAHPVIKGKKPIINKMQSCGFAMVNDNWLEWIRVDE